jgi:hypothetical protein
MPQVVTLVGFQSLFSAVLWNYFMINYNRTIETDMPDILTGSRNGLLCSSLRNVQKIEGYNKAGKNVMFFFPYETHLNQKVHSSNLQFLYVVRCICIA